MTQPESHHEIAAEHYEKAARHHLQAAELLDEGDRVAASRHAHLAHAHALHAHEYAGLAARYHLQLHQDEQ